MTTTTTQSTPAATTWLDRTRFALTAALIWAALHFIAEGLVLPPGLDRPVALVGSPYGPLGGLLVIAIIWAGAALATTITGARDARRPLLIVGVALGLWAAEGGRLGGTMQDWLILQHERPEPPAGSPYVALMLDYLYLLIAVAGAHAIATTLSARPPAESDRRPTLRQSFAFDAPAAQRKEGLTALLITVLVSGVAIWLLMGPTLNWVYRGQVYFAVGLGFFAGVFAARKMTSVRDPIWFWPAPLLLGIIGLSVAAARPAFSLPPTHLLDNIPAWALARPLPVEMVGVGLVGALWMLHPEEQPGEEGG